MLGRTAVLRGVHLWGFRATGDMPAVSTIRAASKGLFCQQFSTVDIGHPLFVDVVIMSRTGFPHALVSRLFPRAVRSLYATYSKTHLDVLRYSLASHSCSLFFAEPGETDMGPTGTMRMCEEANVLPEHVSVCRLDSDATRACCAANLAPFFRLPSRCFLSCLDSRDYWCWRGGHSVRRWGPSQPENGWPPCSHLGLELRS